MAATAGVIAALVGALAWAALAYFSGYEVGYLAWGIGLAVGFAIARLGGHGTATGATAAVLTVLAIFSGKLLATQVLVEKELSESLNAAYPRALYDELRVDASDWAALQPGPSESEVRTFMVEHAYFDAAVAEDIGQEDLALFHEHSAPFLVDFERERPSFELWRDQVDSESRAAFESEFSLTAAVFDEFNAIDLVFAFLAVSTAFGLVSRASGPRVEPEPSLTAEGESDNETRRAA